MTSEAAGAAWENPLIPNAKLRQIYLAMVQARTLAKLLRGDKATLGLEACLVSTSVDLGPGDLVSDGLGGGVVEFLRGAKLSEVLRPGNAKKARGVSADCGEARRLPAMPGIAERIWGVLGAAAALKAEAAKAKVNAKASGETEAQKGLVVMYALPGEAPAALWRKALAYAGEKELPVVFAVLPARCGKGPKPASVCTIAIACGLPGIPVDAEDAVAIYRVAQESIGRIRIGGGPVLVECVPFGPHGTTGKHVVSPDAIAGLEGYMIQRKVVTRAWMDRQTKAFSRRAVAKEAASK